MLNLIIHNQTKEQTTALENIMSDNTHILTTAQAGDPRFADSQGWLDTDEWASENHLNALEKLAKEIRENADAFVLIGVGGSNNAARSVIGALKEEGNPEIIYAGNTLSPNALNKILKKLNGKSIYIDCIAKNFETLEPGASFRILRKWMYEKYGSEAPKRIIATGTKGSYLEEFCNANGYTFLEFPENIGGRYSALSNVGLLPMAVAGIDIRALVKGAHDMQLKVRTQDASSNQAYQYACLRNLFYRQGYRLEILSSFEPQFKYFYKWWIQLFAESEGKVNKGIFPVSGEFSEELHSVGQFIQDGSPILFETFLEVKEQQNSLIIEPDGFADRFDYLDGKDFWQVNKSAYNATLKAHSEKLPCLTIQLDRLDAYHFGQMFYFFEFACYLSCEIMGVNAFDQPGVEAYKNWMFQALGK